MRSDDEGPPDPGSAHLERGWELVDRGDLAGALRAAERSLELEGDNPEAHNLIGYVRMLEGQARIDIAQGRNGLSFADLLPLHDKQLFDHTVNQSRNDHRPRTRLDPARRLEEWSLRRLHLAPHGHHRNNGDLGCLHPAITGCPHEHPEEAVKVATQEFPTMPAEDLKATMDRLFADSLWSKDGMISEQSWKTAEAVVREAGLLKQNVAYDQIIDMQFVKDAAAAR